MTRCEHCTKFTYLQNFVDDVFVNKYNQLDILMIQKSVVMVIEILANYLHNTKPNLSTFATQHYLHEQITQLNN